MPTLTSKLRARWRLCVVVGVSALFLFNAPRLVDAQGLIQGVQQGAREGNKAAGPVGGVLGGAIGGVVGAVTGVFSGAGGQQAAQPAAKDNARDTKAGSAAAKGTKVAKDNAKDTGKAKQVQVLTQENEPQLTADQIVANSDGYIERICTISGTTAPSGSICASPAPSVIRRMTSSSRCATRRNS
jgi:hypothetical protein